MILLPAKAQLLDSLTLDTLTAYSSIQEAMKAPDKVIKLELRKKKLKEFPKEILNFKKLQYLDLSKNSIVEVPDWIDSLKDLQILIVSKNELEFIPKEIGGLPNLIYLNLNQNEISMLPPQIGNLGKPSADIVLVSHDHPGHSYFDGVAGTPKVLTDRKSVV